jgi:hypothetical protein
VAYSLGAYSISRSIEFLAHALARSTSGERAPSGSGEARRDVARWISALATLKRPPPFEAGASSAFKLAVVKRLAFTVIDEDQHAGGDQLAVDVGVRPRIPGPATSTKCPKWLLGRASLTESVRVYFSL